MIISSTAFKENEYIPSKYSYDGENVSPPLTIDEVPTDAISLALICHDPDAPRPGGFTHWLIWNIDPSIAEIDENTIPEDAVVGTTDWGDNDWGGPAPPSGTHHYQFIVHALDKAFDLPFTTTKNQLMEAIEPHIIESAVLTGLYKSKN